MSISMKNKFLAFSLLTLLSCGQASLNIGRLKNPEPAQPATGFVVGFTKYYVTEADKTNDASPVGLVYAVSESDTLYARMHINDDDVDFIAADAADGAFISRDGKFHIDSIGAEPKTTITVRSGDQKQSVDVLSSTSSG
jgi:hypothetical protein